MKENENGKINKSKRLSNYVCVLPCRLTQACRLTRVSRLTWVSRSGMYEEKGRVDLYLVDLHV